MNYLFPIPYNYSKILNRDYSELAVDPSIRKDIKVWIQDKFTNTNTNTDTNDRQKIVTILAITIINSIAITVLPEFVVWGCTIISAIAYVELARIVEARSWNLQNTLIAQRIIEHLADPNQKGQKITEKLEKTKSELKSLEQASLDFKRLFGENSCLSNAQILKDDAEQRKIHLEDQLKDLKKDLSFFQRNSGSLRKLTDVWEKIDRNNENKVTACRDFMFYSLIGTALINIGRLKELIGKNDYARYITYPSLIIGLGIISVTYAAKQVFSILVHRNDEGKKTSIILANVTENEREDLLKCFP